MEKEIKPSNNGIVFLLLSILFFVAAVAIVFIYGESFLLPGLVLALIGAFVVSGLFVITPNQTKVLLYFGKYRGTIKSDGFYWLSPLYNKKNMSLRVRSTETNIIKVNDEQGNPILISSVVVWKIIDTYKAVFDIEVTTDVDSTSGARRENSEASYQGFVKIQSEAALRKIAHTYPYDDIDENAEVLSLRSGVEDINKALEEEIRSRVGIAGIEIQEARISNLSYAPEIAAVMLQRQQAQAIIGARKKIVEGSVGIIDMALSELEGKMELSASQKVAIISNLLVVLCSESETTPVIRADM